MATVVLPQSRPLSEAGDSRVHCSEVNGFCQIRSIRVKMIRLTFFVSLSTRKDLIINV